MSAVFTHARFALVMLGFFTACGKDPEPACSALTGESVRGTGCDGLDCRQAMRDLVQEISVSARSLQPEFQIVPQNGHELITLDGEAAGPPAETYLAALDGVGREDLFYGYDSDDVASPEDVQLGIVGFLDVALASGVQPLVTDYVRSASEHIADSQMRNAAQGYVSFAAPHRDLDLVPNEPMYSEYYPYQSHAGDVTTLSSAKNFLYLLDPSGFSAKAQYLSALGDTDYDVLVIDSVFDEADPLTETEVASLKTKASGGRRLVIAYMSIGEAENYRAYWQADWQVGSPAFIAEENPEWCGNFKVKYWDPSWKSVIYGSGDSYLQAIVAADFDGVYLDIIDAFEYFE